MITVRAVLTTALIVANTLVHLQILTWWLSTVVVGPVYAAQAILFVSWLTVTLFVLWLFWGKVKK